jgi:hypothetical protein
VAGLVAREIQAGRKEASLRLLGGGTPFSQATEATVLAIRQLKLAILSPPPGPDLPAPVRAQPATTSAPAAPLAAGGGADDWATF